jgi:anti-sigma factor RsiW
LTGVMGPHVTESLSAYMDGELALPEREAVAAHLRGCPSCARHLEELLAVDAAARELPLSVPDGYFEAFRGSLRGRLQGPRPARRRLAPAWALAAAAALVLAVLTPRLRHDMRAPGASAPGASPPADAATAPSLAAPPPASLSQDRIAEAVPEATRAEPAPAQPAPPRLQRGRADEQRPAAAPPAVPPAAPAPQPAAKVDAPAAAANAAQDERKEADELRSLRYAGAPAEDRVARTPPATKAEAESGAGHAEEGTARRDKAAVGGLRKATGAPADEDRFQLLAARTVASAADARGLRDAWRAFARGEAAGGRADEARVRAIEAGAEAWRRGKDERDRAETLKDGRAYLERPDALQADRVREALKSLDR